MVRSELTDDRPEGKGGGTEGERCLGAKFYTSWS